MEGVQGLEVLLVDRACSWDLGQVSLLLALILAMRQILNTDLRTYIGAFQQVIHLERFDTIFRFLQ